MDKDWDTGKSVVFSHGWGGADDMSLTSKGYRCITHDCRGHGPSSQPMDGNNMHTLADDLSQRGCAGFSMGGAKKLLNADLSAYLPTYLHTLSCEATLCHQPREEAGATIFFYALPWRSCRTGVYPNFPTRRQA